MEEIRYSTLLTNLVEEHIWNITKEHVVRIRYFVVKEETTTVFGHYVRIFVDNILICQGMATYKEQAYKFCLYELINAGIAKCNEMTEQFYKLKK